MKMLNESASARPGFRPAALLLAVLLPLGLMLLPGVAHSAPPGQGGGPRPTVSLEPDQGGGGGSSGSGGGVAGFGEFRADTCANASGRALLWGAGGLGDVGLTLDGGSWHVDQVSAGDGSYNFGALGSGVGILRVNIGQEAAKTLRPMINNAAIRLTCDFHTQVNVGFYSTARRPQPPGEIWMGAEPRFLKPGGTASYHLLVRNSLPTGLSQAVVTDLLPEGLTVLDVVATGGQVEILDDRMVTVFLGDMASGQEENISIKVKVAADLEPGGELLNSAALFYAESAADQDWLSLPVGVAETVEETEGAADSAASASEEPAAAPDEPAEAQAGAAATEPPPAAEAAAAPAGEEEASPEDLPDTGWTLTASLSAILLAGLVMFLLARGFLSVAESPGRD